MKTILLTRGKVALVDDEDYAALASVRWHAHRGRHTWYVEHTERLPGGGSTHEKMHRIILALALGRELAAREQPDHINGDGLDNQRANLRVVTNAQNGRNCRRRRLNPSSRNLGVCRHKASGKWQSEIRVPGRKIYLGLYETEIEAALAREDYIGAHPELMTRSNFAKAQGRSSDV